ncbi:outer membrane beta-barrel protein [Pedobacter sp. 22163]|uniref:outer membrane beta-barrel protein n=1 Tax=Pedobacter sp. 22163 TaxID=3453883 RepID=UPI003F826B29
MKNSIKIGLVALAISSFATFAASAQEIEKIEIKTVSPTRFSVGVDAGLASGRLNTNYNWSLGGSIQADIPLSSNSLFATLNAGYTTVFADKNLSPAPEDINLIPVKAGLKYFLINDIYVQGEAGVSFILNKKDVGYSNSASFLYAPQVGILIPVGEKNRIDAGVRYESNTRFTQSGSSGNIFALRVAYAFGF